MTLTSSQVLDAHVRLAEDLKHPSGQVARYFNGFMESVLEKAHQEGGRKYREEAWTYLFYPAKTGVEFARLLGRSLTFARTYEVSVKMMEAVTATYHKSMEHVDYMTEQEVPSPAGFCWFDEPLVFTDVNGKRVLHRALTWGPGNVTLADGKIWPGVRLTMWVSTDDEDDYWDAETMADLKAIGFTDLTLSHSVIIPFGQRFLTRKERKVPDPVSDDIARWSHTLFMFMDMELTALEKSRVERHARRRALRSLDHSEVNVVYLRRVTHAKEGEPGHRVVDWSCRWVVQGFWRHLDEYAITHHHAVPDHARTHCADCAARITWVRPHLRGPSDKPLKQPRQLFKLVR